MNRKTKPSKSPGMMVRSTFHHFRKDTNTDKLSAIDNFVQEYREAVRICVDYLWGLKIEWGKEDNRKIWDREHDLLNCPPMISTRNIEYKGNLSARALKCAATQACGIVRAVANKRRKDLNKKTWILSTKKTPGKSLLKRISKSMTKPDCLSINCELNSICMDVMFESNRHFDGFVNFKCLWNKKSEYSRGFTVRIPVKSYKRANKWKNSGKLKTSVILNETAITLRWDVPIPPKKSEGKIIAIDQGKLVCLTSSDGQESTKDIHGHDLSSIVDKLALKSSGSKAFQKASEHRKNYINWAVKKLDLTGVKEIKLEKIVNINYGRNVSREMKRWVNTVIRDSVTKVCEETGVLFTPTPAEYNSQRCSMCGWVQKANRKGKFFKCKHCGYEEDSDFNATQNILVKDTLFVLPEGFRKRRLNLRGFFWTSEEIFDADGQELTVPVVPEEELCS